MLGLFKGSAKKGGKGASSGMAEDDDDLPFARDDGPDEVPAGLMDDAPAAPSKKSGGLLSGLLGKIKGKGNDKGNDRGNDRADGAARPGKKGRKGKTEGPDPFDNPAVLALIASEVSSLPPPSDVPEDEVAAPVVAPDLDQARHSRPGVDLDDGAPPPEPPAFDDDDDMPAALDDLDEEEEDGAKRPKPAVLVGAVAGVALLAAAGGAWWMLGGDAPPAGGGLEVATEGEDPAAPKSGKTITMAMPTTAKPLADPTAAGGEDGRSLSRRPWLAEGGEGETDGKDGAPSTDDPAGTAATDKPAPAEDAPAVAEAPAEEDKPAEPQEAVAAAEPAPPADPAPAAEDKPAASSLPPEQRLAEAPKSDLPPLKEPLFPTEPADKHVVPAFDRLPVPKAPPAALAKAPVAAVARTTPQGIMPFVGAQGETAWQVYGRPFSGLAGAPRVAIVVTGLGMDPEATEAAIVRLPPDVTLSFSPYAPDLANQVARARAHGHEVMLDLPLEGENFPSHDTGPLSMLSLLPQAENVTRLEGIMGKAVGYTGFVGTPGAKFGGSRVHMRSVLEQLAQRGLMYVHTGPESGLAGSGDLKAPVRQAVIDLDARPFREAIDARLAWLEEVVRKRSAAVAVVSPLPVTFERLNRWIADLDRKGLALAPASAVLPPRPTSS